MIINYSRRLLSFLFFVGCLQMVAVAQSGHTATVSTYQHSNGTAFFELRNDSQETAMGLTTLSRLVEVDQLCGVLVNQAELRAQNHLNNRGRAELVVVDNAVARAMICPAVFDRSIKLMRLEDIQRGRISAYIEFEEVVLLEPYLATAKYKLICTEGCNSWQYNLKLKIYEGTSNWAIIQNASAPISVESTNK